MIILCDLFLNYMNVVNCCSLQLGQLFYFLFHSLSKIYKKHDYMRLCILFLYYFDKLNKIDSCLIVFKIKVFNLNNGYFVYTDGACSQNG